jgi:hypothetical protein
LADPAVCGVQLLMARSATLLLPQVVVVQLLPELAALAVQADTPVGPLLWDVHVVAVKLLPEDWATAVQVCTAVGPLVIGALQVVEV